MSKDRGRQNEINHVHNVLTIKEHSVEHFVYTVTWQSLKMATGGFGDFIQELTQFEVLSFSRLDSLPNHLCRSKVIFRKAIIPSSQITMLHLAPELRM
jgi:hypothetical protein